MRLLESYVVHDKDKFEATKMDPDVKSKNLGCLAGWSEEFVTKVSSSYSPEATKEFHAVHHPKKLSQTRNARS